MSFLKRLGNTLLDLVTSKKAIMAISTGVAGVVGNHYGLNQTELAGIIASGVGFVVAQGQADKGKSAAQIAASAATAVNPVNWSESDKALAAKLAQVLAEHTAPKT